MYFITKLSLDLIKFRYLFCGKKANQHFQRRQRSTEALAVGYQPKAVESDIKNRIDNTHKSCKRGTFRMILPPPNVTGQLHLGHALMATIQDVICRRHRQLGYNVEWIPGTDHAGIATQVVVEKKLQKESGRTRQQIGREAFLNEIWNWKSEKGAGIIQDLKNLGCTLDWDQEYFTMDERQAYAVNVAFIKLFEDGLIKRQKSLVNWSCALESAVSDIEVDNLEIKGPTEIPVPGYEKNVIFGKLYNFSYKIYRNGSIDSNEEIVVSTTRPETMLGDIAVAVHPEDSRYIKYRNEPETQLWHPFRNEPIPLIFDVKVEQEFGTGAVKITPSHDKTDFEIAERHLLEGRQVFTEQGTIASEYKNFSGLSRFIARERILDTLSEYGLLRDIKDHNMNLPICSRSKDVIEYMMREQWFLHCQNMANAAMAEVRNGRLQIIPSNFEIEWHRWLENCHDWCISRQLWWGHQIPAYYGQDENGNSCWVAAHNEEEALQKAKQQLKENKVHIKRDLDVLDTWFSSALLPFSVSDWPNENYKLHYPLDVMETGYDILFFWVARMTMLGIQLTGEIPFKKILLNGIICDANGRKMSKSLGNVITPQQVIKGASLQTLEEEKLKSYELGILSTDELKRSLQGLKKMFPQGIPECGTDALRITLCSHNIKSHFINFDVNECYTNKLFLNKIWQATRYLLGAAENLNLQIKEIECLENVELNLWDRWILSRLAETLRISMENLNEFNLHSEIAAFKQFFYNNLCDVYLETTKPMINAKHHNGYIHCATLATCLSWGLQAMSPFAPFVTEALLRQLPRNIHLNINDYRNPNLEQEINEILEICFAIRQLKSRNNISKKHQPQICLYANNTEAYQKLSKHLLEMKTLTLVNEIVLNNGLPTAEIEKRFSFFSTAGHLCSFGIITNDSYKPEKLENKNALNRKKLEKLQVELERYRLRAESEGFRKSASEEVQRKHIEKIKKLETEIKNIESLAS